MAGKYLYLYHRGSFSDAGYDGVIEPGWSSALGVILAREMAFKG